MVETRDPGQLRLLNLELLRQLWDGQDAVRRSVAKAVSESSLDSGSSYDSETKLALGTSAVSSRASRTQDPLDVPRGDPRKAWHSNAASRAASHPPAESQHPESPGPPRPRSAPALASAGLKEPARPHLGPQEAPAPRSTLAPQSKPAKHRVTFCQESTMPESIWRFRPYLGYDWIAGALDSSSPVTSKPEDFFSTLQRFRESNKAECIFAGPEPRLPGLHEGDGDLEEDHECVYCYRVNRRLFPVPVDPGVPCRLCGTPRDQEGPVTRLEPAQVRVSIPFSVLDPPHQYHIHRRKSFDASDTLALPRHCLLGWDILPPKSEKSPAPRSLDLWSSVCEAQRRTLSATSPSCLALPAQAPPPTPVWSEAQLARPQVSQQSPKDGPWRGQRPCQHC